LQLKALQQYLRGESPSFNHIVTAHPDNLAKNNAEWISDSPPGTQLMVYPLLKNGVILGNALRIIVSICIFAGAIGWICWFSLFRLPAWTKIALAALLPWMRYSSDALFMYIADILNYAAAPWILLATFTLGKVWERKEYSFFKTSAFFALFGFCLGCAYLLKYSLVFISSAAVVYLGLKIFRRINIDLKRRIAYFAGIAVFFVIPPICLNLINYKMSGQPSMRPIGTGLHPQLRDFLYLLANPALAVANAEAFFRYVLFHPGHKLVEHQVWLAFLGLPGGLLLWWILLRSRILKGYESLAAISFFVSCIVAYLLWISPYVISYQTRHIAAAGMAILPLIIQNGFDLWKTARWQVLRITLLIVGIIYIAIPLVSGIPSVAIKTLRTAGYKVGPSGIYNPMLAHNDLAGVRDRLMKDFSPQVDIWYFVWPIDSLDLPGRMILMDLVGYENTDLLRQKKYIGGTGLRIHALLLPELEDGRGGIIRNSFLRSGSWERKEIKGSDYVLWKTVLRE
jgi:hypothetical protein